MTKTGMKNSTEKTLPVGLVDRLADRRFKYTPMVEILYLVWIGADEYLGVAGDGSNGAYEWFHFDERSMKLDVSDDGYGSSSIALFDALQKWRDA